MTEQLSIQTSPRLRARIVGVVYLLYFLTAILGALLTPGTPTDILAHQALFRWGYAVSLVSLAFYVALTVLFYILFRPVNRTLALLAAFFSLVGCVMQAMGSVFQLAPLVLLSGSQSSAFNVQQLQAMAQTFLNLNVQAGYVGIVFFGFFDVAIGLLIWRSTFLPRLLGVPMVVAGVTWLAFLSPPLANYLLTPIQVIGFLAEAALMLWLLVMGVNVQRSKESAAVDG